MPLRAAGSLLLGAAIFASLPARASSVSAEVASDSSHRGLSWIDRKAALEVTATVPVGPASFVDLAVIGTRGAARENGAEVMLQAAVRHSVDAGPLALWGGAGCRLFNGIGLCEVDGGGRYDIAFVSLRVAGHYAPPQSAIGGDTLYLDTGVDVALPGTPVTLFARTGRSSGRSQDPQRAARLRPAGRYHDYSAGIAIARGRLDLGLRYVGADNVRHPALPGGGDPEGRIVAHIRIDI